MKIELSKEDLVYAVTAVERAVSAKNTLPVLAGILITAKDHKVSFKATDLEMAIECQLTAVVEEEGELAVPGRKLSQLAKGLSSGQVILESVGQETVIIRYSRGQISVPCFDTEDFPLLPPPSGEVSGSVPVRLFRRMVRQTVIAASTDELRPVFTGIMTELSPEGVTMVATDTHRLTVTKGGWQGSGSASVIVPGKVLQETARLAVDDEDRVMITVSKSQIFFSFANLQISSRLIVGQFPDYRQVLPEQSSFVSRVRISRSALTESLELATVISREISRGKGSVVQMTLGEDSVNLHAASQDEGTFDEDVSAAVEGETMELNYNARYLLDVLRVMEEDSVELKLTGPATPGVIQADLEDAAEKDRFLYLILPVRVSR